ncbi:MAG TPA: MarR family transcriptional regulator [Candidatus Dormibacteraeota bacterium]|nr:MarR family transcriptional regulator [Candidatus Dormibacteraeota bacterium]
MASNPETGSPAELLRAYLDAVVLSEPLQARIWETAALTLTQVRALRRLRAAPMPLGRLGAELALAPPSITRLADRLEERGLIERTRDGEDRRRVVASLTPEGRRLVGSLPMLEGSAIRAAAEAMSPADRDRLAVAFREFAQAVHRFDEEPQAAGARV